MTRFNLALLSAVALLAGLSAPASAQTAESVKFSLLSGGSLSNSSLSSYAGKIIVLYYYTPW